jgi:hypothetical protein
MQFLIGTDGQCWFPYGRDFTRRFGLDGSWEENIHGAVHSLGQVSLHISPRRYRIRLRPEALTWRAFQQLISVLLDDEKKPVVLDVESVEGFPTEIYADVDDAIARIDDLRAMNTGAIDRKWRSSFIGEPLALDRLKVEARAGLRSAYRSWARRRGELDRQTLRNLLDDPLSAPFLLIRFGRDGRGVTETWPGYITLYNETQLQKVVGQPFEEQPLRTFSVLAGRGFNDVARDGGPRLELIEAVNRTRDAEVIRMRYERLLLPWRGQDGTRYVSGLSRQIWRRVSACPTC